MPYMYANGNNMYGRANANGRAALRVYQLQFPDVRILDQRMFQRLHSQLRDTRSFYVPRHDACQRRAVRCLSLEESILNVVPDRPESSTRAVAHHVSVSHQTVSWSVKRKSLTPLPFSASINIEFRRQSSSPELLPVGGTTMCTAAGASSCAEQLL
ncbi:uncharacterized protein TNCV_5024401 [Trichonephila clavipes]|nr:uncharacterized protein TNCV_5024401 [Trichonephila clavipes]